MERAWNPRQVLDVYPEDLLQFHCSGTTLKGFRCKIRIGFEQELLREAAAILDTLPHPQTFRGNTAQLLTNLRRLAFCTLCTSLHRGNRTKAGSQIETVSQHWLTILLRLAAQGSQPRSSSHHSTRSRSSQASTLPSTSEAISTSASMSARPSRRRYPVDGPYPSPPPSGSTTPTTSYASSSNDSMSNSSYRRSNGAPATDYSSPSGSSSRRSTSSSMRGPHVPPIQVNVNTTVNIEVVSRRRVAALDISSTVSTPPSTPSPPQTPSRRTSINFTRSALDVTPLVETETSRAQRAERSDRTSRTSSRSFSRAPEGFYRSSAPEPSVTSNFSAPLAVIRETFSPQVRNPSRRLHTNPISASVGSAGESHSGRNGINTPISTGASAPVTSRGDEQSFEAAFDASLNSPSSQSSDTPSSSGTSTPTDAALPSWPAVEAPSTMSPIQGLIGRRPISNTSCYICYELIEHYEDAAWCRRGCGQNVHLECFETWRDQLEGMRPPRAVTCGFWYVFLP